jgi:hypothetical protein
MTPQEWCQAQWAGIRCTPAPTDEVQWLERLLSDFLAHDPPADLFASMLVDIVTVGGAEMAQPATILLYGWLQAAAPSASAGRQA